MLGEGGRGAQLPPTGLLLLCNRQCTSQSSFRFTLLPQGQQHLAPQTIQFSFKKPLVNFVCCLNCLLQQIKASLRLAEARVGSGTTAQILRAAVHASGALDRCNSAVHKRETVSGSTALGQ